MLSLDPVWVSAFAAVVAAIAAVVYACFTGRLIKEMRKDRKLAYRPIIKYILDDASSFYPERLVFRLKNVGKGPALDVKISCRDKDGVNWRLETEILPIGSSETHEAILLIEKGDREKLIGAEVFIDYEYKDIFNKIYTYYEVLPRTHRELLRTRLP